MKRHFPIFLLFPFGLVSRQIAAHDTKKLTLLEQYKPQFLQNAT